MKKLLYKQCVLKAGASFVVCWLEDRNLKEGISLRLKDSKNPLEWWRVESVSKNALHKEEIKDAHESAKWHGNDLHTPLKGLLYKH